MSPLRLKPLLLISFLITFGSVAFAAEPAKPKQTPATAKAVEPAVQQPELTADDEVAREKAEADDTVLVARPIPSDPVQVYGWLEKIRVGDSEELIVAKLDTGADTSSVHAENQQVFEKEGKKWVKFVLTDPSQPGSKRYNVEAPLIRTVAIKKAGAEPQRRNVVRLQLQIGDRKIKSEVNLTDRSNMTCPALIGRKTLQDLGWVDSSRTYLADDKIFR